MNLTLLYPEFQPTAGSIFSFEFAEVSTAYPSLIALLHEVLMLRNQIKEFLLTPVPISLFTHGVDS